MKHVKIIATPNDHVLSLVVDWIRNNEMHCARAPLEAEWQCVFLERLEIVKGMVPKDRDCTMLGGTNACYNFNFN